MTFLNALQNKSAQVQATLQAKATAKSSIQAQALDAKFKAAGIPIAPISDLPTLQHAPIQNYEPEQVTVTVQIVTNKKRIDLFFSSKPSQAILDSLHNAGFHYRPSDKAWYHKDSMCNRTWINGMFGSDLMITDAPDYTPVPIEIKVSDTPATPLAENIGRFKPVINDLPETDPQPEKFAVYRDQVDQLLEHLKIRPADLMLLAIDALHKQTFSRDS